jgi:hypothetical protein
VRLEQEKLCLLVMIGVRADGRKELVALAAGFRESAESWADLLRDCRRRGMRAPVLTVVNGALGFWKALREVFPATKEQRCWWHKQANVLAALPKSAHPSANAAMKEIFNAEDIDKATMGRAGPRSESPWPTSSSRPPRPAGGASTARIWSPTSAPEPSSSKANPSNDPPAEGGLSLRSATAGVSSHRRASRITGYSRSVLRWYFA